MLRPLAWFLSALDIRSEKEKTRFAIVEELEGFPMKPWITVVIRAPVLALVTAVFSAALPSVAGAQETLVWARGQDTDSLDPMRSTTAETWQSNDLIYSTLVEADQGKIVPNLAESWTISEDEREVIFRLREGIMCHDGTPFNAHDVKWMVDRMINPKDPHAMLGWFGPITELVVIDDLTVKFVLEKPWGPFLGSQAMVGFIPCDSNDGVATYGASTAVGTGPFMVKEWIKGDRMVLERNPNYVKYGRPAKNPGPTSLGSAGTAAHAGGTNPAKCNQDRRGAHGRTAVGRG